MNALLKSAAEVAAILGTIIEMSDDVKQAQGPMDQMGRLLRLQRSIQKNHKRVTKHIEDLCDRIDAEKAV